MTGSTVQFSVYTIPWGVQSKGRTNTLYLLLPMNEYLNIHSTGSDYQIWPSSVERLPEMGGESLMKSKTGKFDLTESIFCCLCIIHNR